MTAGTSASAVQGSVATDKSSPPLLRLTGIHKAFAGVPALKGVDFELRQGEVHALAGENGAGKSTFIKIVGGAYTPDSGTIEVSGQRFAALTPGQARAMGIAIVYQEFNLLPDLSAAENMFLGDLPRGAFGYSPRRTEEMAAEILRRLGSSLDPSRLVGELTVAEQQLVEIGAALALDARVIVMDEPSTVLANDDVAMLHQVVNRLRAEGRGIIYISHRLDEVLGLADRVTVFKDGEKVLTASTSEMDHDRLIRSMIGRDLVELFPDRKPPSPGRLLEVNRVTVPGKIFDIDVSVGTGEIVGLAGLGGSGKTTLCRALVGLENVSSGSISLAGKPAPRSPRSAQGAGLVMVPEDRKAHGIFGGHSVAFNITVATLDRLKSLLLISSAKERVLVDGAMSEFDIRPRQSALDIVNLSGGNQQKAVLARALSSNPRMIVLDEPTRGVDVGAKAEIYSLVQKLAQSGAGILIASSDVTELLGMCDRILVLNEGRLVRTLTREEASEEAIVRAAANVPGTATPSAGH